MLDHHDVSRVLSRASILIVLSLASCGESASSEPLPVILETDWGPDVDDVGALAVLHALADAGEAEILGVSINFPGDKGPATVDVVNTYYGRPNIPIAANGISQEDEVSYRITLEAEFPYDVSTAQVEEPVPMIRRLLASERDGSVTIISVGFLTNLAALLDSEADDASPLPGVELVRAKVAQLVVMGGRFPEQGGLDYNLSGDVQSSFALFSEWPTPILFSGGEIGDEIWTGGERFADRAPSDSPIRRAYEAFNGFFGRRSWDQTAVWAAVRGPEPLWSVVDTGSFEYDPDGSYRWNASPDVEHAYLVEEAPIEVVTREIEDLMIQPPSTSSR